MADRHTPNQKRGIQWSQAGWAAVLVGLISYLMQQWTMGAIFVTSGICLWGIAGVIYNRR